MSVGRPVWMAALYPRKGASWRSGPSPSGCGSLTQRSATDSVERRSNFENCRVGLPRHPCRSDYLRPNVIVIPTEPFGPPPVMVAVSDKRRSKSSVGLATRSNRGSSRSRRWLLRRFGRPQTTISFGSSSGAQAARGTERRVGHSGAPAGTGAIPATALVDAACRSVVMNVAIAIPGMMPFNYVSFWPPSVATGDWKIAADGLSGW